MSEVAKADEDLVNITIDGVQVAVPQGTLVIRAAEQVGVEIPRFCDHPLLEPAGACRQCLVDIPDAGNGRGFPKPMASCTQPVAEGMVINTQATSAVADKAQQGQMEFLLINHPLDCPMCDKGGECPLQNQAMSNGRGESRFSTGPYPGVKRTFPKPINISPNILLDRERCIVCQRCTRFADEIAGDPYIALLERGAQQQIGIAPGSDDAERAASGHSAAGVRPWFDSYFAGNTIQICPVGALTSSQYRFRSRPFDLISTPGVGEHDACGSDIRIDHRRSQVMRRMAGNDPEVNEEWITDKDRFAFTYAIADDRLRYPQVRDADGSLRPASWPEAFVVAARGLQAAAEAGGVGVLPGGRLIAEDAYAYSKFARVALATNDVDFRARPHSAEEAEFLASRVALTTPQGGGVTYRDLESAATVVLAGLEPEDEAGAIFLRLRKSVRAGGTEVVAVAPFTSRGLGKLGARLVRTAPGEESDALAGLAEELDESAVLLVGERLATVPGALTAAAALADRTGARLAWVPRRAGDRGALEAGCLPWLLPGGRPLADASARVDVATAWGIDSMPDTAGRDADAMLAAAAAGQLGGLVVGSVDPADTADPELARAALAAADFVVALELRESEVTRAADVVFPVAPVSQKAGTFVNWEGRARPFEAAMEEPGSLPDLRVLAGIAEEMGHPLGFRTVPEVRREMTHLGPWDGSRPSMAASESETPSSRTPPPARSSRAEGQSHPRSSGVSDSEAVIEGLDDSAGLRLSTWKLSLDNGSMQVGEKFLEATARPPVALLPQQVYDACGPMVTLTGDRGSVTLPAEVADLPDDVVWVPANSFGGGVLDDLASPGSRVRVTGEEESGS